MEKIYSYKEAMEASLAYFNNDDLAAKVFIDKYALRDDKGNILEKTPEDMHWRIANEFARIEKCKFKSPLSASEIFVLLDRFRFICPQGSPMFGIGNSYQTVSLSNCYVVESPADSIGGIMKTDQQLAQICKRRGGTGVSLDNLRPVGATTRNSSRSSTGVPAFSERYSNTIREIGQSGRRGALMETISIHHPDSVKIDDDAWANPQQVILKGDKLKGERDIITDSRFYDENNIDFCSMKLNRSKVTGANISIKLTDEFLQAVKNNKQFEQRFPIDYKERGIRPLFSKMVDARKVWQKIIHCAWQSAEPGLLFWDLITKYNIIDCYKDFGFATTSTNPCSELPLCELDSCRLLLLNLYSYVRNPFTKKAYFDYELFRLHNIIAQRLMDDMIDLEIEKIDGIIAKIENDPESDAVKLEELLLWGKIREKCVSGRRTGLGVTAAGDALAALGIDYGSDQSIRKINNIHKCQKLAAFESSMLMAKEIGTFPIWDANLEKNSPFLQNIKDEDEQLYRNLCKYGRRNIGILTIAPAGSVSILTQTSSGIEPLFSIAPYTRRKKINHNDTNTKVDFIDASGDRWQEFTIMHPKLKIWMEVTGETDWKKSPWFGNCAQDIDWQKRVKLQAAAQKHIDHAISSTINLPSNASEAQVAEIYETAWEAGCKGMTVYRDGCRSGVLISNKPENSIQKTTAPKRPNILRGEIYATSYHKEKMYVAVGLLEDGSPYEIFTGTNKNNEIQTSVGQIKKESKGRYIFITDDGYEFKLCNGHNDHTADAIARILSAALRHGSDIAFLVEQLQKTHGDMFSFTAVLARTLKKYIKNGTLSTEKCPDCGASLRFESGCSICPSCGHSKCK